MFLTGDHVVFVLTADSSSVGCLWNGLIADFADQFIKKTGVCMLWSCNGYNGQL